VKRHPVIDVHGHWGPWFFAMGIGAVTENLRLMREWGITVQLVSAAEAVTYDAPGGNAKLAHVLRAHPQLRGYLVANPNNLADTEADLRRHLPTGRFVGVKIHTGYPGREISSPQMRDLFALLDSHDAIVLIHTWGADVLDLPRLLADNPRLRVIAAHMGANRWDLAAEAARGCDRLYLEPSCSITDAGQVAHVAARVPPGQLLFGTDATLIDPAVSFGLVEDANLPPAVAEAMYWRNAADLFGLHDAVQQSMAS
jgi:uncharacterized protein